MTAHPEQLALAAVRDVGGSLWRELRAAGQVLAVYRASDAIGAEVSRFVPVKLPIAVPTVGGSLECGNALLCDVQPLLERVDAFYSLMALGAVPIVAAFLNGWTAALVHGPSGDALSIVTVRALPRDTRGLD